MFLGGNNKKMRPIGWMDALFERVAHGARKALHATKSGSGLRAVANQSTPASRNERSLSS